MKPPMWGKRKQVMEARNMSPTQKKSSVKSKKHINVAKNIDKDLDKLTKEMDKYWNDGLTQKVLFKNQVNEKFIVGGFQQNQRRRTVTSNTTSQGVSKMVSIQSRTQTPSQLNKKESDIEKPVTIDYSSATSIKDEGPHTQKKQASTPFSAIKKQPLNQFNDMIFLRS